MLRCQESAGILFPGKKAYPIEEWREMNFGAYEGKNYEDLKNDSYYQKWIDSNGTLPFPEGESQQEYIKTLPKGTSCRNKNHRGKNHRRNRRCCNAVIEESNNRTPGA